MSRFACLAATCCLALTFTSSALGQVTDVTDTTSTPIAGAGHDYIKGLSETVNPANGSVSLRIQLPVARDRGLTIPFSFGYDSNSSRHLKPGYYPYYGTANWVTNTGSFGQGGWLYTFPQLNLEDWGNPVSVITGYNNQGPIYTVYNCQYDSSYVFRDGRGGVHALGIGASWFYDSSAAPYCGSFSRTSGGDSQIRAALTRQEYQNYYEPDPVTVYDADGTVYYFPSFGVGGQNDTTVTALPSYIEDRNGNMISWSGTDYKDTLGRSLFSYTGFGPAGQTNTVTVSGLSYRVTWKATPATYSVNPQWAGQGSGPSAGTCSPVPGVNDSQTVVSQIQLPNLQSYTFYYGNDVTPNHAATNPYGLLSEIDYPSGGWVQYSWTNSRLNELIDYPGIVESSGTCSTDPTAQCPNPVRDGCVYLYQSPVVASRSVGFGGSTTPALTQAFTYQTSWVPQTGNPLNLGTTWQTKSTSVTTTDNITGKSYLMTYNYIPISAPAVPFSNVSTNQIPVESQTIYYDWSNTTTPLKTVTKAWYNQYDLQSETTQEGGITSKITYCYVGTNCTPDTTSFSRLQEEDEFDFGQSTPSRVTRTAYEVFTGTPGIIADKPCKTAVYDGNGKPFSETDYLYDGGSIVCGNPGTPSVSSAGGSSITGHDATNYGSASNISRGNLTKKIERLFGQAASPTTAYAYDETGQVTSKTDPNGNVTQYSYADHFLSTNTGGYTTTAGSPPAGYVTNAYVTSVTRPSTTTNHISSFTYGYNDGELTSSTDENTPANTTTYRYNDSLGRLTETDFPDGGQTTLSYSDAAPSPSVTTTKKQTSTANIVSVATMDGLAHLVQTQLNAPEGAITSESTYTGNGWVNTRKNAHRSTALSTDGTTTYSYDALGRTLSVQQPDGSSVKTAYATSCAPNANAYGTTVTDEAGKARTTCTDGLGRVVNVFEDPTGLNYETDYQYDVLGNLLNVTQKGGSTQANWRTRNFVYDSLSRLTSASNPESGALQYGYDLNGNLITKTDARGIQTTMKYDVLNRLTSKSYSDGTPTATFYYDTAPMPWGTGIQNTNGRLVEATTGITPEP